MERTPDDHKIAGTVQKAVIQGTLVSWSRNYGRIFADLERRLHRIPSNWGYRRAETGQNIGSPDRRGEPFQLALVGHEDERETLRIPAELEALVERRADVPYPDYYREIGTAVSRTWRVCLLRVLIEWLTAGVVNSGRTSSCLPFRRARI